jgi:hypothetical protein
MGWWWPGRGTAVGSHVPDLLLAAAMSPTLDAIHHSVTLLPANLPLPVSSLSSFMYPFQIPFLISR